MLSRVPSPFSGNACHTEPRFQVQGIPAAARIAPNGLKITRPGKTMTEKTPSFRM